MHPAWLVYPEDEAGLPSSPIRWEVALIVETEKLAQLLRPPESIVRVDRIARDHLHVPEALARRAVDQIKAGFISGGRGRGFAQQVAGGFQFLLKRGNTLLVEATLGAQRAPAFEYRAFFSTSPTEGSVPPFSEEISC